MTYYEQTSDNCKRRLSALRSRGRLFVAGEILTFILFIGAIALYASGIAQTATVVAGLLLVAGYVLTRRADARNDREISRLEDVAAVCEKELRYKQGIFDDFDDGSRYADARHPFTFDLDIFGRGGLYQRVCRAVTTGGADALAAALSLSDGFHDRRREAIRRLSDNVQLLTDFKRWGQRRRTDTAAVGKAFAAMDDLRLPRWARSKAVGVTVRVYTVVFICALVACIFTQEHLMEMTWWCLVNFFAVYYLCSKSMKTMTGTIGGLVKQLGVYVELVRIVENLDSDEPVLADLRGRVAGAGESLRQLDDILQKLESRGNILGLIIFDMLFAWDMRIVGDFAKWQQRHSNDFDVWIRTVSDFDMLVSMATFRYNEAAIVSDAVVVDSDKVVYEARGLFHPFLGSGAVRNDFSIADRNFYIVTGANMAGKSTFLRSLGVNYVLAMNGMPVFANKLTVSRFSLFTSMRTTDDLTHGISYFNAELLRLRQIIDSLKEDGANDGSGKNGNGTSGGHLIILDEILKGTNSEDKLSGSRMFLEYVAGKNVTGVIATHDLKLSAMAEEQPERFHNYCFEIALGTDVTYSYKITPGVARNQNATFLLKNILKEN